MKNHEDHHGGYGDSGSYKGPCFMPPKDSDMEGEEGEAMINWERLADGKVEITAVNGVSLGGPEKPMRHKMEPGAEEGIDDLPGAEGSYG